MIKNTNEKLSVQQTPKLKSSASQNTDTTSIKKSLETDTNTSIRSSRFKSSSYSSDNKFKISLKRSMKKIDGKKLKFMKEHGTDMNEGMLDMRLKDVLAIVQGYVNQSFIDTLRKKNGNLEDLQVEVDLNNTFWPD